MLALLREAVNTDSGSYDKAGVDAVGQLFIDFFTQHGLLTTREPQRHLRRCHPHPPRRHALQREAHPADGPSRYRVPQGRGRPPPLPHRGWPRLRAGRVRHERRARHQCVRAGRLQALRRRTGAARRPHHQRRGDRLAVLAARHRARRAPGALRVQLRARPALRRRRHRAQGRRVPQVRGVRQGRALGRQLREGHQRDRRARAQGRRHAQADRSDARHHGERRHGQAAGNPSTPRRRTRKARSTCATSSPRIAR